MVEPEQLRFERGREAPSAAAEAEAHLEDLRFAAIGRLTGHFAHEIRNALTSVRCYLELLAMADLPEHLAGFLGEVEASLDHGADLSSRWFDMARAGSPRASLNHQLEHLLGLLRESGVEKRTRLAVDLDAGAGVVSANPQRVESAVFVLLADLVARKPRRIRIETTAGDGRIRLGLTAEDCEAMPARVLDLERMGTALGEDVRAADGGDGPGFLVSFAAVDQGPGESEGP